MKRVNKLNNIQKVLFSSGTESEIYMYVYSVQNIHQKKTVHIQSLYFIQYEGLLSIHEPNILEKIT